MPLSAHLLALAVAASSAAATFQGFNYASSANGAPKTKEQFSAEFKAARNLAGTNGAFNSARLFTMLVRRRPRHYPVTRWPAPLASG